MLTNEMINYIDGDTLVSRVLTLLSEFERGLTQQEIRAEIDAEPNRVNSALIAARKAKYCRIERVRTRGKYRYILAEMFFPMSESRRRDDPRVKVEPLFEQSKELKLINKVFGV